MSHIDDGELTAYGDGAYAPGEVDALRIEAHLAECANCRNRLAQAQALTARASEIIALATPLQVTAVPFETIAATNATATKRWLPYTWAASLIVAVGLGYLMRDSMIMQVADAPQIATAPSAAAPPALEKDAKVEIAARAPTPPPAPAPAAVQPENASSDASSQGVARLSLEARAVTAFDTLHTIPGLEIVSSRMEGRNLVITQKLPDGVTITLSRDMTLVARDKAAEKNMAPEIMVRRGTANITIKGALSADSLRALAAKIR